MPVVGSTSYPTLGTVFTLVRALLNDTAGNVFNDGVLLPYANAAYREVQNELGAQQAATFIKETDLVVAAVSPVNPATQASITDATAAPNQLPTDLIAPLKLWERSSGSSDAFVEMSDRTLAGGLPSREQGTALGCWEWREDGLYFVGSTEARQIRLRYEAAFLDMADASSAVLLRDGVNVVAFKAAMWAAKARGSGQSETFRLDYMEALDTLKRREALRNQSQPRRRRAYGSQSSYGGHS